MPPDLQRGQARPQEGYVSTANAQLYVRTIGQGRPLLLLHGGPDFDHNYLLPDIDRLADLGRLITYDQRGRGRSAGNVRPEDVTLASEMADLEALRQHFGLEAFALLGHSWGGLLALEYALRHPARLSHLILLNTAPASRADYRLLRQSRLESAAGDLGRQAAIRDTPAYRAGDLAADAAYYHLHFRRTLRRPEHLEQVVNSLRVHFTPQTVLLARAIEERLMAETWLADGYDLLPRLQHLPVPTLVLHGEADLIPPACAAHIASALPDARLTVLQETGHFAYLEKPAIVHQEIAAFLDAPEAATRG